MTLLVLVGKVIWPSHQCYNQKCSQTQTRDTNFYSTKLNRLTDTYCVTKKQRHTQTYTDIHAHTRTDTRTHIHTHTHRQTATHRHIHLCVLHYDKRRTSCIPRAEAISHTDARYSGITCPINQLLLFLYDG